MDAAIFRYNPSDYYVRLVRAFEVGYRTGVFVIPSPNAPDEKSHEGPEKKRTEPDAATDAAASRPAIPSRSPAQRKAQHGPPSSEARSQPEAQPEPEPEAGPRRKLTCPAAAEPAARRPPAHLRLDHPCSAAGGDDHRHRSRPARRLVRRRGGAGPRAGVGAVGTRRRRLRRRRRRSRPSTAGARRVSPRPDR